MKFDFKSIFSFIFNEKSCRIRNYMYKKRPLLVKQESYEKRLKMSSGILSSWDNITKSKSDSRVYHGFQLLNNMKVVVVSDPTSEKSAASMDVHVGSYSDPPGLPGLAHFLEHMLFMGTEVYPKEELYGKFISQHGGSCNAYTSGDHTNYYFDVKKEKLRETLHMFAQFFICPLFDESCLEREVKAVHSEHEKNVMSDAWRLDQVDHNTSDPSHDFFKFGTGSIETLWDGPKEKEINIREELLKFHEQFYSSNQMGLCVFGSESIDELTSMVVEMFSDVINKQLQITHYDQMPYRKCDLGRQFHVVPVKDLRSVVLKFQTPDYTAHHKSKPGEYLSHLIGHEGAGSLLSSLKARQLVNSLMAGSDSGAEGFSFFEIHLDLATDELERVEEVVEMVFQYINMLKQNQPDERIFNEIRDISNMDFAFRDKDKPSSLVVNVSEGLHYYPVDEILTATRLVSDFKPDLIKDFLSYLTPDNLRMTIALKSVASKVQHKCPWYGTEYSNEAIDPILLNKWRTIEPHKDHHMPKINEFIATNFDLVPVPEKLPKFPVLIQKTDLSRLWYKQDDQFKLPKAILKFEFTSKASSSTAANLAMTNLFTIHLTIYLLAHFVTELLVDQLSEFAYEAEVASLSYRVSPTFYGIELDIRGFNEKQSVLLEKVISKMANFSVNPKRFTVYKEKYMRALKNFSANQPYNQVSYYSNAIRDSRFWIVSDVINALCGVTAEQLQHFIPYFLSQLHIESLMHGNLSRDDALGLLQLVENILKESAGTKPAEDVAKVQELIISPGSNLVFHKKHKVRDISAVEIYYQIGSASEDLCVKLRLLHQIIDDPTFNILRTIEQLGYIVRSVVSFSNSVCGLKVVVQSKMPPDYLEGRVEAFVDHIEEILEKTEAAEFDEHVSSLSTKILEKPKKLSTECSRYWSEIICRQYQFDRNENEVKCLKQLTKEDIMAFYKQFIHLSGSDRSKLAVYVLGKNLKDCGEAPGDVSKVKESYLKTPSLPKPTMINEWSDLKATSRCYERIDPFIDINQIVN